MKTDLKEHDEGYELKVDLLGFKKDQIDLRIKKLVHRLKAVWLMLVADVHAYDVRIDVDRADDLRAVLPQIAQDIAAHFAASVLNNLDFSHKQSAPFSFVQYVRNMNLLCVFRYQ